MSFIDKFLKKKPLKIENDLDDDLLDENETKLNNDDFNSDFDIESSGMTNEFKEQKNNLSDMIKNNKKIAIGVGSIVGLGIIGVVAEPLITSAIKGKDVMNNNEFEETSKSVKKMSQSTIKEEQELARAQDEERTAKLEKMKAEREAKKKEKEALNNQEQNNVNNQEQNNVNNQEMNDQKLNQIEKQTNNIVNETPLNKKNIEGKEIIGNDGQININKAEKTMEEGFKKTVSKIESQSLDHNNKDVMDPFVQEYEGTINSRAMRNELSENVKLMKDYIEFLDTKKKFEEAKLVYEKKKQKNIFEEEINKVKSDFLVEVDGMKKSMEELKATNNMLSNQLTNKEANQANKENDELSDRKMQLNAATSQKIYKIGQNYLLEETDENGNVKIYKDGNAYKGYVIVQITPEFIKVKNATNDTLILTISSAEEISSNYSKVEIPTPSKSEVENGSSKSNNGNSNDKNKTKVEDYAKVKVNEKKSALDNANKEKASTTSRFLN